MELDDFDLALAEASEQGSQKWIDIRAGRFTSSEMFRLMKAGKRLMTDEEMKARPKAGVGSATKYIDDDSVLPEDFMTYIEEKVAEVLTGQSKQEVFSHATSWGDECEPLAAEFFTKQTGLETTIVSFVPFGDHAGGSPDRFIGEEELIEIKCPYNSVNQVKYLMLTDQWDLKRNYPNHYWQIMSNLLFTDRKVGHFVTFDPRMKEDRHKMQHLKVKALNEDFDLIIKKIELAVKEKLSLLKVI